MRVRLTPKHVVIGANAHAEMAKALRSARPDLEIRSGRTVELRMADLEWGDTYLGFRRPPLPSLGNIRWVHCTGAGVDAWLYPIELSRDILLTRTSEPFGPMIAEWALARALAFTQNLVELHEAQRRAEWLARDPKFIRGTTAVIVGTGEVGSTVGRVFAALGCRVVGVSRSGQGPASVFSKVASVQSLREFVPEAQWLLTMLPLTAATHGLISRDVLAACKGAVLLNAGRGAVVDEAAIPEALNKGWLRGVALDVFEKEPLPPDSLLWRDPRVMISAHISGPTTVDGAVTGFLECLVEIERGGTSKWTVDRDRQY
jgi:phosphoglycerate dehydrogenase-like enzyme